MPEGPQQHVDRQARQKGEDCRAKMSSPESLWVQIGRSRYNPMWDSPGARSLRASADIVEPMVLGQKERE